MLNQVQHDKVNNIIVSLGMSDRNRGKLIIIEGADGTGKTTQVSLLLAYLKANHIQYTMYDFPQYETFYGKLIASYLRGELGTLATISPYISALLFALDRSTIANQMQKDIDAGMLLIANRYVTSNMAHQGGRFTTDQERKVFFSWLEKLEYDQNKMPREDAVLLLDMPASSAVTLIDTKGPRKYLHGTTKDIQESDKNHRLDTAKMYRYLADNNTHWHTISCIQNGTIRSREDIGGQIVKILKQKGIL